ncbi:MAG: molybdopterin-dependent oxidoreductase [Deltaproteobacteria bacterium]|nr:molybdopterin-dependent oxidoreductase [Deltaproteobacteria bacterium]
MEWKKTGCVCCANLCGLEVQVENNRIVKVRGDKDHPRSEGYVCRKGLNIAYHQHHVDRLMYPLKKVGDAFERISWDQAVHEVAEKLSATVKEHGPRSFALMGGFTVACPSQGTFAIHLLRSLGSQYSYNALAQELTGRYWVDGKTFGNQSHQTVPHLDETDMLLAVGWNPMMSHHTPQARRVLTRLSKDPNRLLVVIDPRLSETAKIADIHLPVKPGTDALLYRAMISIILEEGWHNQDYMDRRVSGFEAIRSLFTDFDAKAALGVCELDYARVREVCRFFATRKSCLRSDLGVLMTRHSTLISYLENALLSVCGRIGAEGGNIFPVGLRSGRGNPKSTPDEQEARSWRTVTSHYPAITSIYPPNVMPEEILSGHPDRLRAVVVSGANPLRSYADTTAYEKAFSRLDLLVTVDIAMTETAALSHYVLPALSAYESWDGNPLIGEGFPKVSLQMRPPVVKPEGEQIEAGEIFLRLSDRLGFVPEIPESLNKAADSGDRFRFGMALMEYLRSDPKAARSLPCILSKTLGKTLGSGNLAAFWGLLQNLPPAVQEMAARVGFHPGPGLGEEIFKAVLQHPEGIWVGEVDAATWDHFQALDTQDGRIHLDAPEMKEWIQEIDPVLESKRLREHEEAYPFILSSGRHMDFNANTSLRDPAWNEGKRACTVLMHPEDAERCGFNDGQRVRITTEAGKETIELEVTRSTRPGYIMIPQGFGLVHGGKTYGTNANRLTKNTHRDRIAGTPLHRYIPCKVEAA